jgi:hypothetical protein
LPFESIVVASTDDPKVSLARARQFARAWGARLEIAGAHGHMGAAAELGDWDFGSRLLGQLLDLAGGQASDNSAEIKHAIDADGERRKQASPHAYPWLPFD